MLLVECGGGPVFGVGTENRFGMIIFERIFPYAASSLDSVKPFLDSHAHSLLGLAKVGNVKATIDLQPVFAMLGADDAPGNYRFAGALKKVNATWLVVGDPSDPDDCGPSRLLERQRSRRAAIGHPCFAECFGGVSGGKLTHRVSVGAEFGHDKRNATPHKPRNVVNITAEPI